MNGAVAGVRSSHGGRCFFVKVRDAVPVWARRYADQTEADHATLQRAVRSGRLPAETGVYPARGQRGQTVAMAPALVMVWNRTQDPIHLLPGDYCTHVLEMPLGWVYGTAWTQSGPHDPERIH